MSYAGMPASLALDEFGALVNQTFGTIACYHVGSSVRGKGWRDVDVRVLLEADEWARWGFREPRDNHLDARWVGLVRAFSALGREMTGLPIDFQIQRVAEANAEYPGERHALGIKAQLRWQAFMTPPTEQGKQL